MGKNRHRKRRQLEKAVAQIHLRYGPRSLVKGKAPATHDTPDAIPTGFPQLDHALQPKAAGPRVLDTGGLPRGHLTELLGPPTSGKTTLSLKVLVEAQKQGGEVAFVDPLGTFDPDYAHRCGVDLSRLLVGSPLDPTEALAMAESLLRDGGLAALVFDAPNAHFSDPGATRTLIAALDRLSAPLARANTALLFLHAPSSSPPVLARSAAVRLAVARERWLRRGGDVCGYQARVAVLKNRQGPSGRAVSIAIEFNGTVRGDGL